MPTGWTPAAASSTLEEWTRTFSRGQQFSCFRITVFYGVRAWSCCHLANRNKTCPRLFTHVISFLKNFMTRGSQGFVGQSSPNVAHVYSNDVLNKFFQNYNILPRSGVRAKILRAGSENMPNFVTFWPIL